MGNEMKMTNIIPRVSKVAKKVISWERKFRFPSMIDRSESEFRYSIASYLCRCQIKYVDLPHSEHVNLLHFKYISLLHSNKHMFASLQGGEFTPLLTKYFHLT